MEFDDVILGRRSIRGYKPDPVPRALIEEIIGLAMRAPSSMNTQPWNFYVITGEPLDRIRAGNTERNLAGVPQSREFRIGQPFAGQHRERQIGVAKQLFSAMGIAREDKEGRQDWVLRGFRQFDAPVCVIVTYDRVLRRQRRHALRLRRGDHRPGQRRLVARAGRGDQQPGHHAVAGGARACRHRRRPGDHEEHRAGLAGRDLPGQRGRLRTQTGGRGDGLRGLRRLAQAAAPRTRYDLRRGARGQRRERGIDHIVRHQVGRQQPLDRKTFDQRRENKHPDLGRHWQLVLRDGRPPPGRGGHDAISGDLPGVTAQGSRFSAYRDPETLLRRDAGGGGGARLRPRPGRRRGSGGAVGRRRDRPNRRPVSGREAGARALVAPG